MTRAAKATAKANKGQTLEQRMAGFRDRQRAVGVDWRDVDPTSLVMALHTLLTADVAVMVAPAAGGKGVMVKVYEGGESSAEYMMTAGDINAHLDVLIDAFASSAEDVRQLFPRPEVPSTPSK